MKMKRTYTVVEMAGYEGETERRDKFKTANEADKWMRSFYDNDEIDALHVMIRTDFADGTTEY